VGSDAALAVNGNATVFTIVGRSTISDGDSRAFLWTPGASSLTPLYAGTDTGLGGSGSGANSTANGINSAGNIVGGATIIGDQNSHAFFYSGGKMYDLGTQSGSGDSVADAINNSGVIVGQTDSSDGGSEAFIYNGYQGHLPTDFSNPDTTITDAGYFTLLDLGGEQGEALAINSSGTVVGDSVTGDGNEDAFVYSGGVLTDLNDIDISGDLPTGLIFQSANGINDAGQITGYGVTPDGSEYAFLLTPSPIPEPAIAGLLVIGTATLSIRRRRKM
jgi:probable HAF family extracellular repeat protein